MKSDRIVRLKHTRRRLELTASAVAGIKVTPFAGMLRRRMYIKDTRGWPAGFKGRAQQEQF
jgi:hypothetical protein